VVVGAAVVVVVVGATVVVVVVGATVVVVVVVGGKVVVVVVGGKVVVVVVGATVVVVVAAETSVKLKATTAPSGFLIFNFFCGSFSHMESHFCVDASGSDCKTGKVAVCSLGSPEKVL
jgi:hypothetical protein